MTPPSQNSTILELQVASQKPAPRNDPQKIKEQNVTHVKIFFTLQDTSKCLLLAFYSNTKKYCIFTV